MSTQKTTLEVIGVLMIRDEEDMLIEALNNHTSFCNNIFVLDGSNGKKQKISEEICRSYAQVVEYWRDDQIGLPMPVRDGARKFLLGRARLKFGTSNWYAVLHGDEIWTQDPRPFLIRKENKHFAYRVALYHFFPHTSQRDTWRFSPGDSIENLATWYMLPPISEERLFWDSGESNFEAGRHSKVIPTNIQSVGSGLVLKHYNYRSPGQAHNRAVQRQQCEWQKNHYQHLIDNGDGFFVQTLEIPGKQWESTVPPGKSSTANIKDSPLPEFYYFSVPGKIYGVLNKWQKCLSINKTAGSNSRSM